MTDTSDTAPDTQVLSGVTATLVKETGPAGWPLYQFIGSRDQLQKLLEVYGSDEETHPLDALDDGSLYVVVLDIVYETDTDPADVVSDMLAEIETTSSMFLLARVCIDASLPPGTPGDQAHRLAEKFVTRLSLFGAELAAEMPELKITVAGVA